MDHYGWNILEGSSCYTPADVMSQVQQSKPNTATPRAARHRRLRVRGSEIRRRAIPLPESAAAHHTSLLDGTAAIRRRGDASPHVTSFGSMRTATVRLGGATYKIVEVLTEVLRQELEDYPPRSGAGDLSRDRVKRSSRPERVQRRRAPASSTPDTCARRARAGRSHETSSPRQKNGSRPCTRRGSEYARCGRDLISQCINVYTTGIRVA